jgi:hypothetical protein
MKIERAHEIAALEAQPYDADPDSHGRHSRSLL